MIRTFNRSSWLLAGMVALAFVPSSGHAGPFFGFGFGVFARDSGQPRRTYSTDYFAPGNYGYPLDDRNPGYYGGGRYREYYSFGRGANGLANFPSAPPGPAWLYDHRNYAAGSRVDPFDPVPPITMRSEAIFFSTKTAQMIMHVPEGARVCLDGVPSKQQGAVRHFVTPLLKPGGQYTYEVEATWVEDGREVKQVQTVAIRAGDSIRVHFPVAPQQATLPEPPPLPVGLRP